MAMCPTLEGSSRAEARGAPAAPLHSVDVQRIGTDSTQVLHEALAAEVPVALRFNGRPHAVMLATPGDLHDFGIGFALTEGIVSAVSEIEVPDIRWTEHGVVLEMLIPGERAAGLLLRDRNLTGRTGCGLCGAATLEAAIRPVRRVPQGPPGLSAAAIWSGMRRLAGHQPLNAITGAVHAAGILATDGSLTVREDVGRHNAIDKAVGAVMKAGGNPHGLLVTSRASYEVVHKAAEVGCSLVAAISAPTALALRLAEEAGVTLVGWTREARMSVYCGRLCDTTGADRFAECSA